MSAAQQSPGNQPSDFTPATFRQKVALVVFLAVLAIAALACSAFTIHVMNKAAMAKVSVRWEKPDQVELAQGPAVFRYDAESQRLLHFGPITYEQKTELRGLFQIQAEVNQNESGQSGEGSEGSQQISSIEEEQARRGYNQAIDELAYVAHARVVESVSLIPLLGALGGLLGAMLRCLVDFVGHACYSKKLDVVLWWPLYTTRPIIGSILGFVIVVMFNAQLFATNEVQPGSGGFWWLGVALVGGFSTVDVTERLRLAAKTLFGGKSGE